MSRESETPTCVLIVSYDRQSSNRSTTTRTHYCHSSRNAFCIEGLLLVLLLLLPPTTMGWDLRTRT